MPSKYLSQVVGYIEPSLKKQAEHKISSSDMRMTMSSYIAMLIRKDLRSKKVA